MSKKKKLNQELLKEELKKHNLMVEYSFIMPEEENEDDLILGDEEGTEGEPEEFGGDTPEDMGDEMPPGDEMGDEMGDEPMDEPEMEPEMGVEPEMAPAEDEVELDVTQLVQGTEEAKASADIATQKMEELLGKFGELEGQMANMDGIASKISDLTHEVEKRNPTPDEKLEMRSFDSYPYNLKLTDYWAEKDGAYDVLNKGDETEEGQEEEGGEEYVLTQDDVKSAYNDIDVGKSFKNEYEEEDF